MLSSFGIEGVPTIVKNPQANSILERVHLTMGDQLRTSEFNHENWTLQLEKLCAAMTWALRATASTVHGYTSGQLVFNKDMIIHDKIVCDWEYIYKQRMQQAKMVNDRENRSRVTHVYKPRDLVLLLINRTEIKRKLSRPTLGPYKILQVHTNGTLKIRCEGYDETVSMRRVKPYHTDTSN